MRNTIKRKEVIAYKGMKSDMTCKGFQYEIGKTYKTDKVELCKCGFHACLNPRDVLEYYPQGEGSRYFKVKLSGEIAKCGKYYTEVTATEITILEEINIDEIIKITEWLKHENVLDLLYWSDGLAVVQRGDGLWNYIDTKGKILSEQWFMYVFDFYEGFARVQREDKLWNYIDTKGKILSEQWFMWADSFNEGFARVQRSDEWNYIDTKVKILSEQWFMWADSFNEGFARVQREDSKWNYITKDGNYLSNEWFSDAYSFNDGFASVYRTNSEWAKIDKTGKLH